MKKPAEKHSEKPSLFLTVFIFEVDPKRSEECIVTDSCKENIFEKNVHENDIPV